MYDPRQMVGFCSSPRFVDHRTGPHHPERPDRIKAVYRALRTAGMLDGEDPFPSFHLDLGPMGRSRSTLKAIEPGPADRRWLREVHPVEHIERIEHICAVGGGVLDQGDTPVSPGSFDTAALAVGACLACCDAVASGGVRRAFAAVRPPGHHAEPARPMGFCLFGNVAIAARYLQRKHGMGRIAIVDFDVHHGNGTQAVFESDPSVLFISLHQHPATCYPYSGHDWEIGTGPGRGFTVNIPFEPGAEDVDYLRIVDNRVVPELEEFRPDALLISAGFDAHQDDPLAQMRLSDDGFELMTRSLAAAADRCCGGRIVSVLEGGYHLRALGRSVVRHLLALGA